ncbi:hypothetical protein KW796_02800 [Candidatus Parcubacteria bacterium]|nr:hypothetical protein [Candidatus Parcubacteria bacterium]
MELRLQKAGGKQKPWTLEQLKAGLEHFYKEHKRYPTATEVNKYPYLPAARSIERSFGGLVALRKQFGLGDNHDFRTGNYSAERARVINERGHKLENEVYTFLVKAFGKEFVHREYFFIDDKRSRADFFVYDKGGGFCIDIFYPSDKRNLTGCINSKLGKYVGDQMNKYPVIFLQMNTDISQGEVDKLVSNKKKQLGSWQKLMCWDTFTGFAKKRRPLKIDKNLDR